MNLPNSQSPVTWIYSMQANGRSLAEFLGDVKIDGEIINQLPIVTPEQFGAVGDGVADDAPAFQAMFEYGTASGGAVYFLAPNANYRCASGALNFTSNSIMYGNMATMSWDHGLYQFGLVCALVDNWKIQDLNVRLMSTTPGETFYGVTVQGCNNWQLDNVDAGDENFGPDTNVTDTAVMQYCICITQPTQGSPAPADPGIINGSVTNCTAFGAWQYGFEFFPKSASYAIEIGNNLARNCGNIHNDVEFPCGFKLGQIVTGSMIHDNLAIGCWSGFIAANWDVATIADCTAINFQRSGLSIAATLAQSIDYGSTTLLLTIANFTAYLTGDYSPVGAPIAGISWQNNDNPNIGAIVIQEPVINLPSTFRGVAVENFTVSTPAPYIHGGRITAGIPIYVKKSGSVNLSDGEIVGTVCTVADSTTANKYGCLYNADGARIIDPVIINATTYGIWANGPATVISNPRFVNCNPNSVGTTHAIIIEDTTNTYYVNGPVVAGGNLTALILTSGTGVAVRGGPFSLPPSIPVFGSGSGSYAQTAIAPNGATYTVAQLSTLSGLPDGTIVMISDASVAYTASSRGGAPTGGGSNRAPVIRVAGAFVYM